MTTIAPAPPTLELAGRRNDPAASHRYHLRVTLPDRPGSLGAVAAALGLTGADIVSVTVIERDHFDAVDDIVFDLPLSACVDDVYTSLHTVKGIWVESLYADSAGTGLEGATELLALVAAAGAEMELPVLVEGLPDVLGATWAAMWPATGKDSPIIATRWAPEAPPPGLADLDAPVAASGARLWLAHAPTGAQEVAVVPFGAGHALGVGRANGPPFRVPEVDILEHVADIAAVLIRARLTTIATV